MRYSVSMICEGDRIMSLDEIVELADAVAVHSGVATGIGQESYGAQIIVDADSSGQAEIVAKEHFRVAVVKAGLPAWPIASVESLSEDEDYAPER